MRHLSFGVGQSYNPSEPASDRDGESRAATAAGNRQKRRLADVVESAFSAALLQGELATAEELLGVLENMLARAKVSSRSDRRGGAQRQLERARRDLETRRLARYRRF
ncbi:MAG TPA: hypothetical protein VGG99_07620 [Acetobacteraceae bacterium]